MVHIRRSVPGKEADAKEIGDFRPISILNEYGKISFRIIAWRVISFV